MSTKSRSSAVRRSAAESYQRAWGRREAASPLSSARAPVPAPISTPGREPHPGRCPWIATLPKPMIAPRRIPPELPPVFAPTAVLVQAVARQDRGQRVLEDGEAFHRRLLGDHERRIDPDRRRVRHRDEPAPKTLLVER